MTGKPTYEELDQRIKDLESGAIESNQAKEDFRMMSKVFIDAADPILIEDLRGT